MSSRSAASRIAPFAGSAGLLQYTLQQMPAAVSDLHPLLPTTTCSNKLISLSDHVKILSAARLDLPAELEFLNS